MTLQKNTQVDYYETDWQQLAEQEANAHALFAAQEEQAELEQLPAFLETTPQASTTTQQYSAGFTPAQLAEAIQAFQQGDEAAGNRLYTWFTPLIKSVSYRYTIYSAIGEDAVNIAWELFFTLVKNYHDQDYAHFPGYAKKHLTWRLLDMALSRGYYDPYADAMDLEALQLPNQQEAYLEQQLTNQDLYKCLLQLNPLQRETLLLLFFQEKTFKETAAVQGRPLDGVRGTYRKACHRLRQLYPHKPVA